jgi:uncharacterized OB-fold protein
MSGYPIPDTTHPDFAPFWQGCLEHRLLVPACGAGHLNWPPRPVCQVCHDCIGPWVEVNGRGRLYSWTVVHRTRAQPFSAQVPYIVGVIELMNTTVLRILGRCDIDLDTVRIGLELVVDFVEIETSVTIPVWKQGGEQSQIKNC